MNASGKYFLMCSGSRWQLTQGKTTWQSSPRATVGNYTHTHTLSLSLSFSLSSPNAMTPTTHTQHHEVNKQLEMYQDTEKETPYCSKRLMSILEKDAANLQINLQNMSLHEQSPLPTRFFVMTPAKLSQTPFIRLLQGVRSKFHKATIGK